MPPITANNSLLSDSHGQVGFVLQEQVNNIRRRIENSAAGLLNTQNGLSNYTDTGSSAGISSLSEFAVSNPDEDAVAGVLDARGWIDDSITIDADNFSSSRSSTIEMKVSDWVSFVRYNLTELDEYNELADRISFLVDENEGAAINEKSLATFVMFLSSNNINSRPSVGLNSNGYIDALWRRSKNELIEIVFFPGHESQIVTFSSDLINSDIVNKRVATLPISNVVGVVSSRNLDSLFFENKKYSITRAA